MRSRNAVVTAAVMLSPVSAASSRASRCASSLLMFRLIVPPHLGRTSTISRPLGKAGRATQHFAGEDKSRVTGLNETLARRRLRVLDEAERLQDLTAEFRRYRLSPECV